MSLQKFLIDTIAVLFEGAINFGTHTLQQRCADFKAELQANWLAQKTQLLRWLLSAALALLLLMLGMVLTLGAGLYWCWTQHGPLATAVMGLVLGLVMLGLGAWLLERNRTLAS